MIMKFYHKKEISFRKIFFLQRKFHFYYFVIIISSILLSLFFVLCMGFCQKNLSLHIEPLFLLGSLFPLVLIFAYYFEKYLYHLLSANLAVLFFVFIILIIQDSRKNHNLSRPVLISPVNETVDISKVRFLWNKSTKSSRYFFQMDNNQIVSVKDTFFYYPVSEGKHSWKIAIPDSTGERKIWSKSASFYVQLPTNQSQTVISKIKLLEPDKGAVLNHQSVQLKWSYPDSENVSYYKINLKREANGKWQELSTTKDEFKNISLNFTNVTYYWRVKPVSQNQESQWSEEWSFSIQESKKQSYVNTKPSLKNIPKYQSPSKKNHSAKQNPKESKTNTSKQERTKPSVSSGSKKSNLKLVFSGNNFDAIRKGYGKLLKEDENNYFRIVISRNRPFQYAVKPSSIFKVHLEENGKRLILWMSKRNYLVYNKNKYQIYIKE